MLKAPTAPEKRRWNAISELGCIVGLMAGKHGCNGRPTIHHCGTGGGGRKKHAYTICLCWEHHQGVEGIDGKRMSKWRWQHKYWTELYLFERTEDLLGRSE